MAVLALTLTVMVLVPATPEAGETDSQDWSERAIQVAVEVTVIDVLAASLPGCHMVDEMVSVCAGWVTVTVRIRPPPVKVTVPVRSAPVVLAAHRTVTVRVPAKAVAGETVSQVAEAELVQVMLAVNVTVPLPAAGPAARLAGLTVSDAIQLAWVTVNVRVTPPLANVMVPVRPALLVLEMTEAVTVLVPAVPEVGEIRSQDWLAEAVQVVVEVTVTGRVVPAEPGFQAVAETVSVWAGWVTVNVRVKPPQVKVTLPVRSAPVVLAVQLMATERSPLP
jgi:hypothetical protein